MIDRRIIRASVVAVLALTPASPASADGPSFVQDFARECATSEAPDLSAWRISSLLDPAANPWFKSEAGYRAETGSAALVTKVRGTDNCRDGKAGILKCGPWPLSIGAWHRVHVALKPSQHEGETDLRVWLDGRPCPRVTNALGYLDHGVRDAGGKPMVDTQPRFRLSPHALPEPQPTHSPTIPS